MTHPRLADSHPFDCNFLDHTSLFDGQFKSNRDVLGSEVRKYNPSQNSPSIAFIGWDPFQFRHILEIAWKLENSCIIIEKRQDHLLSFDEDLPTESGFLIVIGSRN